MAQKTHRRKLLQFSLRTTLVVTLLVAVYLAYLMRMEENATNWSEKLKPLVGMSPLMILCIPFFPPNQSRKCLCLMLEFKRLVQED